MDQSATEQKRAIQSTGSREGESQAGLTQEERKQVERRTAPRAPVVHETIRREGEDELRSPSSGLAWSGVAAGLSMGFSLVAEGLLRANLRIPPGARSFHDLDIASAF